MKKLLIFGFTLLVINLAKFPADAVYHECAKQSTSKLFGLRDKLLCDYDSLARPSGSGPTIVQLRLIPKFIEFIDVTSTLIIHSWMAMSWQDDHFGWRQDAQYSTIPSIHVQSGEVWTPDITVYNSAELGYEPSGMPLTNCIATIDKKIMCNPVVKYVTRCAPNFQRWPYDRLNCTLRLGSWTHTKDEIDYDLINNGSDMIDYTENLEWKVLSVNVTKGIVMFPLLGAAQPSIFVNILLERHSTYRQAVVIAPAILLIIMTLTVLWLNPMTVERMILAGLNLICHLLCVMDLNWHVPSNGATSPLILVFHENSMIIASVAFFLTVFLRQLRETSIPAPGWLTSTTSMILENKAGQFFLLTTLDPKASATLETAEEDNAGLVQLNSSALRTNPATAAWHHFATLIDRLSFTGIIFTYAIMLIVLIPKNDIIQG